MLNICEFNILYVMLAVFYIIYKLSHFNDIQMANSITSPVNGLVAISNVSDNDLQTTEDELQSGIQDNTAKLINFRVEQKISDKHGSGQLSIGGFVNANSQFKSLKTRYMATLLSDKTKDLTDANGNLIATKRYGIGFGLSLDVSDIETKINANYGVLAASAKMGFAKVNYGIATYGFVDPTIIGALPNTSGDFSNEVFNNLTKFINTAKETLKNPNNTKLYPIEFVKEQELELEKSDIRSIYFGARQISSGISLFDAIKTARGKDEDFNENVIQFVYRYFGIKDAYAKPTETQKQDSGNWQKGSFNRTSPAGADGSWVQIDEVYSGKTENSDTNYIPHPLPSDWSELGKELHDDFSETSADFSSELKIAAIADISGEFNSIVITRDIAKFVDVSDNRPVNSQVIETRYGVGIRLMIKLSNIEFGTDVSFGVVGAASELNLANVEYEISGIGFADTSILDVLPGPQNITQDTVSSLMSTFDDIKNKISAMNVDDFVPQAFQIRVNEPENVDPLLDAQAKVFAVRQIRDRKRLNESLRKGGSLGLSMDLITETYKDFGIDGNERVTSRNKEEAREWINLS